jgi:hypothetical protein
MSDMKKLDGRAGNAAFPNLHLATLRRIDLRLLKADSA